MRHRLKLLMPDFHIYVEVNIEQPAPYTAADAFQRAHLCETCNRTVPTGFAEWSAGRCIFSKHKFVVFLQLQHLLLVKN